MQLAINRRLTHDYEILDKYTAGIELFGHEVKSIKNGKVNLTSGKIILSNGEAFAVGVDIQFYQENNLTGLKTQDKLRTRRLLLKKNEIQKLYKIIEDKRLHLLPYKIFAEHGLIKLEFAVCRKLKKYDKKEKIKERDFKQKEI